MRILALSPHPDDIEFGCGGFLAKHSNDTIKVVYFSLCEESMTKFPAGTLEKEITGAQMAILWSFDVKNHKVRRFSEVRQDILEELVLLRDEFKPDLVLIPSVSDVHQDHKVIHEEAIRAFNYVNMMAYELPWNCRRFVPTHFEVLSLPHIEKKRAMIEAYRSQSWRHYSNWEFITSLARVRGVQCSHNYAEAFETINYIK